MKSPGTGWSRAWPLGAPHFFEEGATAALCGVPVMNHPLTLTGEADGHLELSQRKVACTTCYRELGLQRKAGRK